MQKLDKKQIPQFAALCVLSAGLFGYFVVRMVTPSPAAAASRPAPRPAAAKAGTPGGGGTPGADAKAAPGLVADAAPAPPPSPGMRDPFAVKLPSAAPAPKAAPMMGQPAGKTAGQKPALGATPGMKTGAKPGPLVASAFTHAPMEALPPAPVSGLSVPGFGAGATPPPAPPLPPAPAARPLPPVAAPPPARPKWTVTGVLQSEGVGVAILRDGDARRIVRVGDLVDDVFRVVSVSRTSVRLRHGLTYYTLGLAASPAPAAPAPAAAPRQAQAVPAQTNPTEAGRTRTELAQSEADQSEPGQNAPAHARTMLPTQTALRLLDDSAFGQP